MPQPAAGELLLKLRVVGFCGTDLFKLDTGGAPPGTVLGHELVGDVAAVGAGVSTFHDGDRVTVPHHVPCGTCTYCRHGNPTMCTTFRENLMEPGGFADYILIRPRAAELAAHRVPDAISDRAAVFMEPAACVLRGIRRSEISSGGTAAVLGAGSMGLLHLLTLRALDPSVSVAMIEPNPERRRAAEELGASVASEPGAPALAAIGALTDGLGVDAVFDTVGGPRTLADGIALTRRGGSVVLFAHAPDGARADFDLNTLFKNEQRIIGTYSGALNEQKEVFELIASGALDPTPLVTHTMPLNEFDRGVRLVRQQAALKVLFTPSQSEGDENADG